MLKVFVTGDSHIESKNASHDIMWTVINLAVGAVVAMILFGNQADN